MLKQVALPQGCRCMVYTITSMTFVSFLLVIFFQLLSVLLFKRSKLRNLSSKHWILFFTINIAVSITVIWSSLQSLEENKLTVHHSQKSTPDAAKSQLQRKEQNPGLHLLDYHGLVKNISFVKLDRTNVDILYPQYEAHLPQNELEFLNVDLYYHNDRADWLSKRLFNPIDIVKEAQRVQYHIFSRLLVGFQKALISNVPTWNTGNLLVTLGQKLILEQFDIDDDFYCFSDIIENSKCLDFEDAKQIRKLGVFFQGGSDYLGDTAQLEAIQETMDALPNARAIIFFPTSLSPLNKMQITQFAEVIEKSKFNVTLLMRDRFSLEICQRTFLGSRCLLCPDASYAIGYQEEYSESSKRLDFIWINKMNPEILNDIAQKQRSDGLKGSVQEWEKSNTFYGDFLESSRVRIDDTFQKLARARVSISDHLHAHFMSMLLNQRNVMISSPNENQENYVDTWERSVGASGIVNTVEDAFQMAKCLLKSNNVLCELDGSNEETDYSNQNEPLLKKLLELEPQ